MQLVISNNSNNLKQFQMRTTIKMTGTVSVDVVVVCVVVVL